MNITFVGGDGIRRIYGIGNESNQTFILFTYGEMEKENKKSELEKRLVVIQTMSWNTLYREYESWPNDFEEVYFCAKRELNPDERIVKIENEDRKHSYRKLTWWIMCDKNWNPTEVVNQTF